LSTILYQMCEKAEKWSHIWPPQEVVNIAAVYKSNSVAIFTSRNPPSPPARPQQNDLNGSFLLLFGASGYRQRTELEKNIFRKLIFRRFWTYFSFCLGPPWAEKTCLERSEFDQRGFATAETGIYDKHMRDVHQNILPISYRF
jgi:hypothetical protein